jgi:hypothetical protein
MQQDLGPDGVQHKPYSHRVELIILLQKRVVWARHWNKTTTQPKTNIGFFCMCHIQRFRCVWTHQRTVKPLQTNDPTAQIPRDQRGTKSYTVLSMQTKKLVRDRCGRQMMSGWTLQSTACLERGMATRRDPVEEGRREKTRHF